MAAGGVDQGMVIKNTFLEVGTHQSIMELSETSNWRRAMSDPCDNLPRQVSVTTSEGDMGDPVKIFTKQTTQSSEAAGTADTSQGDSLLEPYGEAEENALAAKMADSLASGAHQQSSPGEPPAAANLGGKPPQILLLADSLPRGQKDSKKAAAGAARDGKKAPGAERREVRTKDHQINSIKNFDITEKEPPWTDVTTVMMRNLPNKYTQTMLLEELQDSGFKCGPDFDFFYLPMDHTNAANLGYCFINFTATAMANAFAAAFQLKRMRRFNSNKTVVVMPASIQGYERNHAYYSSTRVVQAEDPLYRPLFMKNTGVAGAQAALTRGSQGGKAGGKGAAADAGGAARADKKRGKGAKGGSGKEAPEPDQTYALAPMAAMAPLLSSYPLLPGAAWPAAGAAMPAPAPAPLPLQQAAAPPPQVATTVCQSCNSECSASHRFCAFCGSQISAADATSAAALRNAMSSMRADAPSFEMPPGGYPQPVPAAFPMGDAAPPVFPMVDNLAPSSNLMPTDTASDELDILRGRMMLLAALKEMESRDVANTLPAF